MEKVSKLSPTNVAELAAEEKTKGGGSDERMSVVWKNQARA